jgi:YVTN family beta-propeller protein
LDTGPRTNQPNFVTVDGVDYACLTVGDLSQTLVYRRSTTGGAPTLVKTIANQGKESHGLWPSPDNTRMYVAPQYSDAVDVIDTKTMEVINTLRVGQSPMAAVYVARSGPGSTANLSQQGLGMRIENRPIEVKEFQERETPKFGPFPGSMRSPLMSEDSPRTAHSQPMPPAATAPSRCSQPPATT